MTHLPEQIAENANCSRPSNKGFAMTNPAQIAKSLSQIEKDWFFAKTWGSWLWGVGQDLTARGLVEINGSYMHETDLGKAVRAILEETP